MGTSKKELIMMRLQITSTSPQETRVNVTFRYKEVRRPRTLTRHDEAYLVEFYQAFFEFMDAAFPAK